MSNIAISEDEKRWRRQDDARALATASEIMKDKVRMKEAQLGAKEILEREKSKFEGLENVARGFNRRSNKATVSRDIFTGFTK